MIRPAQAGDIPGILNLLLQVGRVHNGIRPDLFQDQPCKYDENALLALMRDENRPIFVSVRDDRVEGYAFCILERVENDPVLRDHFSLYIDDLCVDEHCRGRHIGTALYDHVCAFAREIGCDSITLNVWEGNDSARRFYESKGMRPRKTYMEIRLEDSHG